MGIATLLYAGGLATTGESLLGSGLSPGDWYLFMQAVGFYWWPLTSIASFWSQFQDGLAAADRPVPMDHDGDGLDVQCSSVRVQRSGAIQRP